MKVLIAADVVPTLSNESYFIDGHMEKLVGQEIFNIWKNCDYSFFNLEAPLYDGNYKPIEKCGPNLRAKEKTINGIKQLNPTAVTLANNHINDYGTEGIKKTIEILNNNDVNYFGIGNNSESIKKSYLIDDNKLKIGIYNCCESEFSGATKTSPGANLYNEFSTLDDIVDLKNKCDKVIVLYHGAKEYYRYPSPRIQKLCRHMIDKGADVVICQHSHCIGCEENYNDGKIIYGQGNFIFDGTNNEFWNSSLLLMLNIKKENIKIDYYPIEKNNEKISIINEDSEKYKKVMSDFFERSNSLNEEGYVIKKYKEYCKENFSNYLSRISNRNFGFKVLNKIFGKNISKKLYNRKDLLRLLNTIECETHRELLIQCLKNELEIKNVDE